MIRITVHSGFKPRRCVMVEGGVEVGATPPRAVVKIIRLEDRVSRVSAILHEAAETHHIVYRIVDGTDADWAS